MTDTTIGGMLDAARAATGLSDFGDEWFLGPLAAWAEDLDDPRLNDFGRGFLRALAVRDLARRLRVLHTLREHPQIDAVPMPPIVYITGLERSGTTLLHNLLALHPRARALLRWELMEPVPPPRAESHASDPRIAAVQASVDKLRGSLIEAMHWVNADEPEECVWGFIDAVGMLGQAAGLCMPRWWRWICEADMTPAFAHYRRVVQLLLWRHPVEAGGFLVLKAPQIARHIAAFAGVFPEARFVVTDRDPFRCLASMVMMGRSIIDPFCADNPLADDGRRGGVGLANVAAKLAALDAFADEAPARVQRVAYPDLVGDGAGTAARLLAALGLPPSAAHAARIAGFLAAQRSGKRAAAPGHIDAQGYEHDRVLAEPRIAAYCARHAIAPERQRLC